MKEQLMKAKNKTKIMAYLLLAIIIIFSIVLGVRVLPAISFGAEDTQKLLLEVGLEKYINYSTSDQDKETLVQYNVKEKIEYGENYIPAKNSELVIQLNQIDGKYPYAIKTITKSTAVTNGKTSEIEENCAYDVNTGTVILKANNQNEQGELIYQDKPSENAVDEYIILCYYDTYTEKKSERDLALTVSAKSTLSTQEDSVINADSTLEMQVTENIGTLTSINYQTEDIYNGYIKSNKINGTDYNTQYKETEQILVSKKEAQEKLEVLENSTFVNVAQNQKGEEVYTNLENNHNLVYKSTKITKESLTKILGEDAVLEVLDANKNVIATINKDTQFDDDGTITIYYESEPEVIMLRTSEIQNEGILSVEHTKEIKSTITDIANMKIKTTTQITGICKEILQTGSNEEKTVEKQKYVDNHENIAGFQEAKTNASISVSNTEWTNRQQNEITFNVSLNANTIKDNMFKNPSLRIELPNQVEKVIIQNSGVFHANGLELQDPYLETSENGNIVIVANLTGAQTAYSGNALELSTDVKITATIILKKDIETTQSNINLVYTNQYTLDGSVETGNQSLTLQIESYQEEQVANVAEKNLAIYNMATTTPTNVDGLKLEVAPVKGETDIKDGATVYEGEYIKYNVKVTNTSDEVMNDVKIVGGVPEGTTYGELIADYYKYNGDYYYKFDETVKSKEIQIGTLEPGKSITKFYEVKVNDLEEEQKEKEITSNIKAYIGQVEVATYELKNIIKTANANLFVSAKLDNGQNRWNYFVQLTGEQDKEVTVTIAFPKEFQFKWLNYNKVLQTMPIENISVSENNVVTATLKIDNENPYIFEGIMDSSKIDKNIEPSSSILVTTATMKVDDQVYTANENRVLYEYNNASIFMTSPNEGEEVKYGEEIEYDIVIKNTGGANSTSEKTKSISVQVTDFLPENVQPVSVTYETWEQEKIALDEENGIYTSEGAFTKQEITEDINNSRKDENGNQLPNVEITSTIPYQESITIKVKTIARLVYEKTKVENTATVTSNKTNVEGEETTTSSIIGVKTSNTITHTILPYDYEEQDGKTDEPGNTENPKEPNNSENPSNQQNEKYSISGVAWLDVNEDGQRQADEQLLSGITVMVVDTKNATMVKDKVQTGADGAYRFSDLDKGDYIVLFQYDTNTYRVTEYQKNGVSSSSNSDAVTKEVSVNGETIKGGVIEVSSLEASVSNMDIGLVENKICDFKLDKSITKVTVTTNNGTKQYSYNNEKLAKIEIKAKEIQGATVIIEYKIVITNEGELASTVGKVIDYLPEGLTFSSELNKNWSAGSNGQLINTSLSNQKIGAGESVELTLIATKAMTTNSTGTFTNAAEIGDITNSLGIADTDSTPGNKVKTEDDYSEAAVIISVSTGLFIYLSMGILLAVLVGIAIFVGVKKGKMKFGKIAKISMFLIIAVSLIFLQNAESLAITGKYAPQHAYFRYTSGTVDGDKFECIEPTEGIPIGTKAYCIDHNTENQDKNPPYYHEYELSKETYTVTGSSLVTSSVSSITLTGNTNNNINMEKIDNNDYLFGPFNIVCNNNNGYSFVIKDKDGEKITDYSICNENGEAKTIKGNSTFYLKIPSSILGKGISSVQVSNSATITKKMTKTLHIYTEYTPAVLSGKQRVKCEWDKTVTEETSGEAEATITWANINGSLEIIKQDADNSNVKLEGVEITVSCPTTGYSKTVTTDKNGRAYLENLPTKKDNKQLTYSITEVKTPHYGYIPDAKDNKSISSGQLLTYNLKNTKYTGNLQIVKRDTDSNKTLGGISFKIKISADINQDGIINVDDATQLKKYIENKSEKLKPYGFGDLNKDGVINDDDVRVIQEDLSGTGSYIVVSDSNDEYKGKEVTGTISLTNMKITKNADEATTFITNDDGEINILNMLTGYYCLEETSVGDNFGYADPSDTQDCLDGFEKYINYEYTVIDENGNEKKITESGNNIPFNITKQSSIETGVDSNFSNIKYSNKLNVYNKKKYIKLSGYVWDDIRDPSKSDERDNIWDTSNGLDQRVNNVLVTLYNKEGTEIDYRTTGGGDLNSDGSYIFGDYINDNNVKKIKIEELDGVYIEFKYNGMSYESVATSLVSNGSKATDKNLRDAFNKKYMSIENDKAIGTDKERVLKYEKHETISTLTYGDGAIKGYHNQKFPISGVTEDNYSITASTSDAYPELLLGQELTINEILKKGEDEISNINLGLYEREQPDISLKKDLQNVRVSINGYDHIYNYNSYYINMIDKEKTNDSETGVEWGYKDLRNKGNVSYTRAIYKSDYLWENADKDKELKVYVTYELKMINESNNLYTMVNSIVDYYDNQYNIVSIGTGLSNNEESTNGDIAYLNKDKKLVSNDGKEITIEKYNNNYNKIIINNRTQVKPRSTKDSNPNHESIYVQFELTREAVAEIIHIKGEESKGELLENVAEINSYSTFFDDKFSEIYAGIDEDSNPGNCNPEDEDNYEDDTFACPALKLEEGEERSISGTVFLDESVFDEKNCFHESKESTDTHTGEERNGNGEFNEGESTISGVKVKLYKENQINNNDDGTIKITGSPVVETTYKDGQNEATGGNGEFEISGFIPDKYIIVYTWGDETYISGEQNRPINVEEYKGTIYINEEDRQDNEAWYKNYDYDNKRYSDAMDDYELRKKIDEIDNDENIKTMNSTTPTMDFAIELDDVISDEENKYASQEFDKKGEKKVLTFKVPNVDFGITERARQEIAIDKRINSVKLTLANGQVILHAEYEEDTKQLVLKTGTAQIIKHRDENNVNRTNGQLWESLDNELIQGSTLEVTYKIVVNNNSEKDYDNKEYYLYGPGHEIEEKIVMQQPTGVYDYLDKTMSFEAEKQDDTSMNIVKINNTAESYEKKVKHNLLEGYLKQYEYSEDNDGVLKNIKGYEYYSDEWKNIIEKYWESSTTITEQLAQSVLNEKTIIEISNLESEMSPGEENNVLLKTSKQLTSTDEIVLDNEVEIVDAKRTTDTGRRITVTSSEVYSKGETVIITPPTGDNQNYVPYIVLMITLCIILGAGVVIIKKKALK